jgi:uncharacterized repeat protein (TIGR03943 family)
MTKTAQNMLLILVGVAVLRLTVATDEYLNYVKPGLHYLLVAAAVVVIVLGVTGLWTQWGTSATAGPAAPGPAAPDAAAPDAGASGQSTPGQDRRDQDEVHQGHEGHGHGHRGPRVAWLLALPVLAIFLVAPPALGSFTAARATPRSAPAVPPPSDGYPALPAGDPVKLPIGEFIGRSFDAQAGSAATLNGRRLALTGFAMPSNEGGWYLTRLHIACCAADAIPMQVIVQGIGRPPKGAWVEVTGTWIPPTPKTAGTGIHAIQATGIRSVRKPARAYE